MELAPPGGGTRALAVAMRRRAGAALARIVPGDCHGLLDANGGVLFASPSVEKVTGYTPSEYAALDRSSACTSADRAEPPRIAGASS